MSKRIKLSSQLQQHYLNSDTADVFFECVSESGQSRIVPAHKFVLLMCSDVFKSMFCSSSVEGESVYQIIGSADAFQEFLQLFYFDHVRLTVEHAHEVLSWVQAYQIKDSSDVFRTLLKEQFTKDKACWGYQLANFTGQNDIKALCEEQFIWYTDDVFKSTDFLACPRSTLCVILQIDRLSCSEAAVFNACIDWGRAACERDNLDVNQGKHLREKLGFVLYQIRFRSMTFDEFSDQLASVSGLFTADELEEIIQLVRPTVYNTKIFTSKIRMTTRYCRDADRILKCHLEPTPTIGQLVQRIYVENVERTTFSTTKTLLFGEFACIAMRCLYSGHSIPKSHLTITQKSTDESQMERESVLLKKVIALKEVETRFLLPKAIRVKPGFMYEIRLEHSFGNVFLKTEVFEQRVQHIGDIAIQFHDQRGIVSALYFNE